MKSLRLYLITSILAAMILLIFISALQGYHKSANAAHAIFDKQLVAIAEMLSSIDLVGQIFTPKLSYKQSPSAYQIWQEGELLSRSSNTPNEPFMSREVGFQDRNFEQNRWRCYAYFDEKNQRWIMVAERIDSRNQLVDNMIMSSTMPTLLILPIAWIMIWVLVGRGLRPINLLAQQLKHKQASDLTPLSLTESVKELAPLVESSNGLLQRLQNALEREKRFSADAAHELRTPVSVLMVYLHNLATQLPKGNEDLQQLTRGVERMAHLIEQILALYRSSPDQYASNFEAINLYELVQTVIAQRYAMFEGKNQQIELLGEGGWLQGDLFALDTLVSNILINACKYTPNEGDIKVTVHTEQQQVVLSVEDSGPGIPEDQYERIFDRFYRLHGDQHTSGVTGCGLGLSIVQHIVQLHHADIILSRSSFSSGLNVTVRFPLTT